MDARIAVHRTSEHDIKIRDLYVSIDDQPEENLPFGKSIEVPLNPGPHIVTVTNRLYTEKSSFEVAEGQSVSFIAANRASGCGAILFMVVGMGPYRVELKRQEP